MAIAAEGGTDALALNRLPIEATPHDGSNDDEALVTVCRHGIEITWNQFVDMQTWDTVLVEYISGRGKVPRPFYAIENDPWRVETAATGQLSFAEHWRALALPPLLLACFALHQWLTRRRTRRR